MNDHFFEDITLRMVAEKAKVTPQSLYQWFEHGLVTMINVLASRDYESLYVTLAGPGFMLHKGDGPAVWADTIIRGPVYYFQDNPDQQALLERLQFIEQFQPRKVSHILHGNFMELGLGRRSQLVAETCWEIAAAATLSVVKIKDGLALVDEFALAEKTLPIQLYLEAVFK